MPSVSHGPAWPDQPQQPVSPVPTAQTTGLQYLYTTWEVCISIIKGPKLYECKIHRFQGRNRQILWHQLGFVHFWQAFGWSLRYRGWSVSTAVMYSCSGGTETPNLSGVIAFIWIASLVEVLAKSIQSMESYSELSVKRMRTSKVDQENKIYPRVRFHRMHICMHTHTHTSPSLELICPVALKGVGWGLSAVVKPEGRLPSHGDVVKSLSPGNLPADFHSYPTTESRDWVLQILQIHQ